MIASKLTKDILAGADGSLGTVDESQRVELVAACEKLKATLESPFEVTSRILFGVSRRALPSQSPCALTRNTDERYIRQTHQAIALRLGIDLKIFDVAIATATTGTPVTVAELAIESKAEPQLISQSKSPECSSTKPGVDSM